MKRIYLHGDLAKFHTGPVIIDVLNPAEAIRALCALFKGFQERMSQGHFRVIRGDEIKGMPLWPEELGLGFGKEGELHIVPIVAGAGRGIAKVIIGIVLIVAAFYTGGASLSGFATLGGYTISAGSIAMFGVAMVLSGVSMMMTPSLKGADQNSTSQQQNNFLLSGSENVAGEGMAVPLVFGRVVVGSVVGSVGVDTVFYSGG